MAVGYNPRAITDGLVLALDAGNPKNYNAGISTNWTDKVGGNNGTLVGGTNHNDGPFVGAGYVEFDGTGDYLTTATHASDFNFGTGDFTIEFWINSTQTSRADPFAWNFDYTSAGWGSFILNVSSGRIDWYEGLGIATYATSTGWNDGLWHHLAVSRSGTSLKVFLDGVQIGTTASSSYSYGASDVGVSVGFSTSTGYYLNGQMSNVRILKGTALYTSNFTPPTKSLTAITNTVLLTCQGNTISPGTDIVVTTSNKGSGSVGSLSAVTSSGNYYFDNRSASPSTASIQLDFKTVQVGVTQIKLSGGGFAVGSTFDLYVNGVLVENDRSSVTLWGEDTITISSTNISSIKIEGSDGYSLGALKFNGTLVSGTITEIVPNGDISLTKEPFAGAGAVQFDGTGDYLTTANHASDFNFGSSDFTMEFWANSTKTGRSDPIGWNYNYTSAGWAGMILNISPGSGSMAWYENANSRISGSGSWNDGSWHHIAVTRDGNSVRMFLDGTQIGSTYTTSHSYGAASSGLIIGALTQSLGSGPMDGQISNVRVLKGTALYTSAFTPPSRTLEPIENTVLLTCQGQNIKDYSSNAHAITVNGDAKATIVSSAFEFDGTNDYVDLGTSTDFNLPGDFSIDTWIKLDTTKTNIIFNIGDYFGSSGIVFYAFNNSNNALSVYTNNALAFSSGTVPLTTWTHTALVRSGSTNTLYINGTSIGTFTNSATFSGSGNAYLGTDYYNGSFGNTYLDGKISSARLYKGKALTAAEVLQNYNATKGRYA